jgi:hypothetical protein
MRGEGARRGVGAGGGGKGTERGMREQKGTTAALEGEEGQKHDIDYGVAKVYKRCRGGGGGGGAWRRGGRFKNSVVDMCVVV